MTDGLLEEDLPGFWRDADRASQNAVSGETQIALPKMVKRGPWAAGATFTWRAGRVDVAAAVILLGFTTALVAEICNWLHKPTEQWYEGRALAESAKTLAWRYAVGADPFPISMPQTDARSLLLTRLNVVGQSAATHVTVSTDSPLVTAKMSRLRGEPFDHRRDAYITGRTNDQRAWYAENAERNKRKAILWRSLLVGTEVLAVVLASMRVLGGWSVDIAGFMAALVTAGAAWISVKQFSQLGSAYSIAALELTVQAQKLLTVNEDEWPLVVADAEEAISREHTMWLASRTGKRTQL